MKERQYYLIYEAFKCNLLQSITLKSNQDKFWEGKTNFSEQEIRHFANQLIDIFGDLQS